MTNLQRIAIFVSCMFSAGFTGADAVWTIDVLNFDTLEQTTVLVLDREPLDLSWSSDGDGFVYAARGDSYDLFSWTIGDAQPINLTMSPDADEFRPVADGDDILFLRRERKSGSELRTEIARRMLDGTEATVFPSGSEYFDIAVSNDGLIYAFAKRSSKDGEVRTEVYVADSTGGVPIRLTPDDGTEDHHLQPSLSPDNAAVAFTTVFHVGNQRRAFIQTVNLTNLEISSLTPRDGRSEQPTWSSTGKEIAFTSRRDRDWDIFVLDLDTGSISNLSNSPEVQERHPVWSPRNRLLAFTTFQKSKSDESIPRYTTIIHSDGSLTMVPFRDALGEFGLERTDSKGNKVLESVDKSTAMRLINPQ